MVVRPWAYVYIAGLGFFVGLVAIVVVVTAVVNGRGSGIRMASDDVSGFVYISG